MVWQIENKFKPHDRVYLGYADGINQANAYIYGGETRDYIEYGEIEINGHTYGATLLGGPNIDTKGDYYEKPTIYNDVNEAKKEALEHENILLPSLDGVIKEFENETGTKAVGYYLENEGSGPDIAYSISYKGNDLLFNVRDLNECLNEVKNLKNDIDKPGFIESIKEATKSVMNSKEFENKTGTEVKLSENINGTQVYTVRYKDCLILDNQKELNSATVELVNKAKEKLESPVPQDRIEGNLYIESIEKSIGGPLGDDDKHPKYLIGLSDRENNIMYTELGGATKDVVDYALKEVKFDMQAVRYEQFFQKENKQESLKPELHTTYENPTKSEFEKAVISKTVDDTFLKDLINKENVSVKSGEHDTSVIDTSFYCIDNNDKAILVDLEDDRVLEFNFKDGEINGTSQMFDIGNLVSDMKDGHIKHVSNSLYTEIVKNYEFEAEKAPLSFKDRLAQAQAKANEHNSGLDNKDNNKNKQNER